MADTIATADDTAFLGHPRGLGYMAFTKSFEQFSYYGMQALLVLYLANQLLLPGHVEHVAGFAQARAFFEGTYGGGRALSIQALAAAIVGFYTSTVYLTPILGGL